MARVTRNTQQGFVGLMLNPDLLKKLDKKVTKTTLNRSQVVRLAIIEYLQKDEPRS